MKFKFKLIIGYLCLINFIGSCSAMDWNGITPFKTTRSDVIKLLGTPKKIQWTEYEYFEFNGDRVEFNWIDSTCAKKYPLNYDEKPTPDYLVSQISVTPKVPLLITDPSYSFQDVFAINCSGSRSTTFNCFHYDSEIGFAFSTNNKGVTNLQFYSPEEDFEEWKNVHRNCFIEPPPSPPDCPIRQTTAFKIMQTTTVVNPDKFGSSSIFTMQNCSEALELFLKELPLRREAKDTLGEVWVLTQIGDIYDELNKDQEAVDYYLQALPLFRQTNNYNGKMEVLNKLASISEKQKDYSQSLKYLEEELLTVRASENKSVLFDEGRILDCIANIYSKAGEDTKAFEYFNKRLAFEREQNSKVGELVGLKSLAKAYEAKGKKAEALEYYQKALEICSKFSSSLIGSFIKDIKELNKAIERLQNNRLPK